MRCVKSKIARIVKIIMKTVWRVGYVIGAVVWLVFIIYGSGRLILPDSAVHYMSDLWEDSVQFTEDIAGLGLPRAWQLYRLSRCLHDYALPMEKRIQIGEQMMQIRREAAENEPK